ncbi:MAG: hypothetical protein IPI49_25220 [Myxococcales bacterium]|nr:hypothetical protein [Myxococcales bacterium]
MSTPTLRTSLFFAALGLCSGALAGTAVAQSTRGASAEVSADPAVVVLSFDGDDDLAVSARSTVLALVDRDYEVVPPRMWRDALDMDARGRTGKAAWAPAARELGVAAVVEGAAIKSRGGGMLRLWVRDAHTGKVMGEVSAPLSRDGLDEKAKAALEMELVDALFAATDGQVASRKREAARARTRPLRQELVSDRDDAGADEGDERADDRDDDGANERDGRDERADEGTRRSRSPRGATAVKVEVASSQSGLEGQDRLALFDAPQTDGSQAPSLVTAAPVVARPSIAEVSLTASAISRQFGFTGAILPADYPGSTVTSVGLAAAVYPMSQRDARGRLSGFGLAGAVTTAVGSEVPVEIDEEVFDFPVSQRTWQIGLHYRWPAGPALVDGHLGYGSITHYVDDMPEDADLELDLLDAEYGFLDLGGRVEIEAGPRTTLGFSASYLYMTQVGIVTDPDLLGGVKSWGMKMGLDLKVQLKKGVYAAAGADYRRVSMVFDGDGELFDEVDVDDAKDTFVGGHLDVGVAF